MKLKTLFSIAIIGVVALANQLTASEFDNPKAEDLVDVWQVDLRPTPDAPAYFKDFVVKSVDGNGFIGTFYDSPISNGRINTDWGAVYFAFTTSDGSGTYNHSGVLRDGKLEGLSLSIGRGFLGVWRGEKKDEQP
jgi:hypothetical protein